MYVAYVFFHWFKGLIRFGVTVNQATIDIQHVFLSDEYLGVILRVTEPLHS